MQDILINWSPQETRVAVVENGAVQELHLERTLERGLVGNIYLGKVARVLPGMQSAFVDIGLERAAFLHVADVYVNGGTSRGDHAPGAVPPPPIEKHRLRGPDADGAGDQGPDRHQGRAAVDADLDRRAPARLPAAGRPHRHLAEDRLARAARAAARAHDGAGPGRCSALPTAASDGGGGFILRTNAEEASDAELADDIAYLRTTWARGPRARASSRRPGTLLHQDLSLAERVLRDLADDGTQTIRIDSRDAVRARCRVRPRVHAERGRQAAALHRRAADLRPLQRSTRRSRRRSRGASS